MKSEDSKAHQYFIMVTVAIRQRAPRESTSPLANKESRHGADYQMMLQHT